MSFNTLLQRHIVLFTFCDKWTLHWVTCSYFLEFLRGFEPPLQGWRPCDLTINLQELNFNYILSGRQGTLWFPKQSRSLILRSVKVIKSSVILRMVSVFRLTYRPENIQSCFGAGWWIRTNRVPKDTRFTVWTATIYGIILLINLLHNQMHVLFFSTFRGLPRKGFVVHRRTGTFCMIYKKNFCTN